MITLLTEELRGYDAAEASYKKITEKLTEKQEQRKELAGIRDQYAKALQMASEESRREGIKQAYAATFRRNRKRKRHWMLLRMYFRDRCRRMRSLQSRTRMYRCLGC